MDARITRRDLLKTTGVAAAAGIAASAMPLNHAVAAEEAEGNPFIPSFLVKPEPVTEFAQTYDYDVVVVGAGEAGLSAVHSALEAGAKVACLQNMPMAFTTGNMAASIDLDQTSEAALQACISFINWKSDYRSSRPLVEAWARNSQEALAWWAGAAAEGGVESKPYDCVLNYNSYDIYLHANTYFHQKGAHNDAAAVIAEQEAAAGADFYYDTPAVQLVNGDDGSVTGVVAQNEDGEYLLFNAAKGVILCTGDYTGNAEMRNYYCPDVMGFGMGLPSRDGSGYAMGMWAGAIMTPPVHTKMIHGEGAPVRLEMPFLFVDTDGNRFMDENCGGRMGYNNNYGRVRIAEHGFENMYYAKMFSIVPNTWRDYVDEWIAANPYEISIHNAYREVNPENWIQADTLEDLCDAMNAYMTEQEWGVEPMDKDAFVATVTRYNELCDKGEDDDFGKDPMYMIKTDTAPFYAVPRGSTGVPAILSGLVCDGNHQCLNGQMQPIKGLYAAGNASGQFFGGVDYPMNIEGLSIGRAITSGYVVGKHVASL